MLSLSMLVGNNGYAHALHTDSESVRGGSNPPPPALSISRDRGQSGLLAGRADSIRPVHMHRPLCVYTLTQSQGGHSSLRG